MKITNDLRKAINAGVRNLCGTNPLAELRYAVDDAGDPKNNGLLWAEDADLFDLHRFANEKTIDDDPTLPNCATLDLYVTSGTGSARELETNVYVTIKDGKLADIHTDDLKADARTMAILGRPFSRQS